MRIETNSYNYYSKVKIDTGHYYTWNEKCKNIDTSLHLLQPRHFAVEDLTDRDIQHSFFLKNYDKKKELSRDVIDEITSRLDIDLGKNLQGQSILSLQRFGELLKRHLHGKADIITRFNRQASDILKVYCCELNREFLAVIHNTLNKKDEVSEIQSQLAWRELNRVKTFFQEAILQGASSKSMAHHWLEKTFPTNAYVSEEIQKSTVLGIQYLSNLREPHLKDASLVSRKLLTTHEIIEHHLTGRFQHGFRLVADDSKFPDPKWVVEKFTNRKQYKSGVYGSSILLKVFHIVKTYLEQHRLEELKGSKRTISREIQTVLSNDLESTDLKTIDRWVKFYWDQYMALRKTQGNQKFQ